ncbi:hypothetical protein HYQ46_007836 [Verticillium longisporum]|nr:hypothetical protein HYQ46_007836 [Verticillium longisporum]
MGDPRESLRQASRRRGEAGGAGLLGEVGDLRASFGADKDMELRFGSAGVETVLPFLPAMGFLTRAFAIKTGVKSDGITP